MRRIFLSMARPVSTTQQRRHVGLPSRRREVGLWQRKQGSTGNLRFMARFSIESSVRKSTFPASIHAPPSYIHS
jgi:hypothetical protein